MYENPTSILVITREISELTDVVLSFRSLVTCIVFFERSCCFKWVSIFRSLFFYLITLYVISDSLCFTQETYPIILHVGIPLTYFSLFLASSPSLSPPSLVVVVLTLVL